MSGQGILAIVNLALVTVLVLVTGFYAWQTRNTVKEMRAAREAQILPKLSLGIETIAAGYPLAVLRNLGLAAAIDVTVKITEKRDTGDDRERTWSSQSLFPGERIRFFLWNRPDTQEALTGQDAIEQQLVLSARMTYKDLLGTPRMSECRIDVAEHMTVLFTAGTIRGRGHQDDLLEEMKETTRALNEKIPAAIKDLAKVLGR